MFVYTNLVNGVHNIILLRFKYINVLKTIAVQKVCTVKPPLTDVSQ